MIDLFVFALPVLGFALGHIAGYNYRDKELVKSVLDGLNELKNLDLNA